MVPKNEQPATAGSATRRSTGPKPQHSREKIARAAVELADREGIAAVSIRGVAAKIGSGAASLYRYVDSSEELMELMIDQVSAEYELHDLSGNATEQLLALAAQGRSIMHRHPWVAPLLLSKSALGPHALAYLERGLAALQFTELTGAAKLQTIATLTAITSAFVQNEQGEPTGDTSERTAKSLIAALETGKYPLLAESIAQGPVSVDQDAVFATLISNYLRGAGLGDS
ncbi:TetR/AcrR family transcriptional regulator [Glutamicibacter arilaitensis]|uniref:TetR/AcrR family transcriptional regulator n=1 Tax=Glutamicibacter arilaitensis TaxID=256701 RepID=UPI00384E8702